MRHKRRKNATVIEGTTSKRTRGTVRSIMATATRRGERLMVLGRFELASGRGARPTKLELHGSPPRRTAERQARWPRVSTLGVNREFTLAG
jgi:hypothetical protein